MHPLALPSLFHLSRGKEASLLWEAVWGSSALWCCLGKPKAAHSLAGQFPQLGLQQWTNSRQDKEALQTVLLIPTGCKM